MTSSFTLILQILGIVGAISGTLYVCVLPISLHLVRIDPTAPAFDHVDRLR